MRIPVPAGSLPELSPAEFKRLIDQAPSRRREPRKLSPRILSEGVRRRRMVAAAGLLPPQIAWRFRPSEQAVLGIIGDRIRTHGLCDLYIEQIGAMAGVSRKTVQNTVRLAVELQILSRELRPVRGRGKKSRTNVLRIVSREWLAWLQKRKGRANALNQSWSGNPLSPMTTRLDSIALKTGTDSRPRYVRGPDYRLSGDSRTIA